MFGEETYMMNNNMLLGEKFAHDFNKKYGVITYSGTLAIEVALSCIGLKKGAKVLVLSEVCYSIVNTILKLDFIPVIVTSINGFSLTDDDVDKVLEQQNIDCILLVHQYGILNEINLKKYKNIGIKVIEDVAQAWSIGNNDYKIGKYSDIVVTSFGITKPLSYGVGGGLFFNQKSIFDCLDYYDNESREKEKILFSYTYPLCESIEYNKLKSIADNIVKEQRNNAKQYYDLIKDNQIIHCIKYDDRNVWHRFPIWVDDEYLYHKMIKELNNTDLKYQLLHEINLIDLKRNKHCIHYNNQNNLEYVILLRTRNVDINKQIEILKSIIDVVL